MTNQTIERDFVLEFHSIPKDDMRIEAEDLAGAVEKVRELFAYADAFINTDSTWWISYAVHDTQTCAKYGEAGERWCNGNDEGCYQAWDEPVHPDEPLCVHELPDHQWAMVPAWAGVKLNAEVECCLRCGSERTVSTKLAPDSAEIRYPSVEYHAEKYLPWVIGFIEAQWELVKNGSTVGHRGLSVDLQRDGALTMSEQLNAPLDEPKINDMAASICRDHYFRVPSRWELRLVDRNENLILGEDGVAVLYAWDVVDLIDQQTAPKPKVNNFTQVRQLYMERLYLSLTRYETSTEDVRSLKKALNRVVDVLA